MILDGLLMFDNAAAITTSRASTNTVDLLNPRDLGVDDPLQLLVQIVTPFTGGTSLTVQFQGSIDNAAWTTYAQSDAVLTANLTAGNLLPIAWPRPAPGAAVPRYIRLNYIVVGTFGAGAVTSTAVEDRQANVAYPAGLVITN